MGLRCYNEVLEILVVGFRVHPPCLDFLHIPLNMCHHLDCLISHLELGVKLEWRIVDHVLDLALMDTHP
jgi:hypothetical protein